ncbi:ribosome assembly RNA-binding protein YhbY [Desulfurivibrio alkaliphilus]|uniref:CRM domain-containing protein n=1 Tax=Desulfurivibrio alkaliphilus (strain DSM 19089 / UNIQEM U267 / AHT2) TaxID=589865 RepID=D6Z2Y6_DESAT|nr:ribosome assembly RNA-binding protein YhbY [Desulfurivibrio alkaliphilus]ADH85911.1 protein of unknown function UPF0044 [Desulfurivibrio alkaliphilus AHT 2]
MPEHENLYLRGSLARELRAQGHHLNPTVMVGREGLTAAVLAALEAVLTAHELVKIKIQEGCPEDKTTVAQQLAADSNSRIVQIIGGTILLYRRLPPAKRHSDGPRCDPGQGECPKGSRRGHRRGGKTAGPAGSGSPKSGTIRSLSRRRKASGRGKTR